MTSGPVIVRPSLVAGLAAVDLDQWGAGVARLGEAVDQYGIGDRGQGRGRRIVWTPWPGISKSMVLVLPVAAIGVEDRLAERAGAAVGGRVDQEAREQRPVFHNFDPRPEPEDRPAEHSRARRASTPASRPTTANSSVIAIERKGDHRASSGVLPIRTWPEGQPYTGPREFCRSGASLTWRRGGRGLGSGHLQRPQAAAEWDHGTVVQQIAEG